MKEILRTELARFESARSIAWQDEAIYGQYLAQTYHYVCHSTRLLAAAAARMGTEREKVHHRFLQHAAEERSHHLLAQRDLAKLGRTLSDFPELPATSALYETQYYRIERVSPMALFGYILALEGNAVTHGPWLYEVARQAHGAEAVSFLRLHAKEDPDHLDSAFAMVAALGAEEQRIVLDNLRFSCAMYETFLQSIVRSRRESPEPTRVA